MFLFYRPFYRIQQIIITPTNQENFYYPVTVNRETVNISWSPVFEQDFLLAVCINVLILLKIKFIFNNG